MLQHLTIGVLLASTLALLLLVASANTCRFVWLAAIPDAFVEVIDTSETGQEELTETFFDAFCDGHLMNIEDDIMWLLVKIFHIIAIALAAAAAFLATMVHFVSPRIRPLFWQVLSICSALCALMSVPVFLLFETNPCKDFPEQQSCSFGLASYIHVGAIVFAVISTICTQCFDPPKKSYFHRQSDRANTSSRETNNKQSGRYWLPLQSEKEQVSDDSVHLDDEDILEKGAVVTTSTEEEEDDDVEEDRAHSDAGVIGITQSQEQIIYEPAHVDLRGPTVVYESLERDAPEIEPSLAPTDEMVGSGAVGPRRLDLTKLPSLVDEEGEEDESGEGPDDLGSLEPTVLVITGAESVLDQVDSMNRVESPPGGRTDEDGEEDKCIESEVQLQKRKGLQLDLSRFMAPRRRNGYRLMDDTELESSLPLSPPLEIITMNMINTSLEFDDFEDLYENEHMGLDEQLHQPQLVEQRNADTLPDDDALDPELLWNDDDDFVGIVSSNRNKHFQDCGVNSNETDSPPVYGQSCTLKRRRNSRWNAGMSLASANSLLSYAIAEETASDLVETDEDDDTEKAFDPYGTANLDPIPLTKSRSAPNLARFDKRVKNGGWVTEDVQLDGVNSYKKKAQVFSVAESSSLVSSRRSTGGMKEAPSSGERVVPASSSSLPDLLKSGRKRLTTFREEKVLREGIHATTSNVSDTSSIDGGFKSLQLKQSKNSRSARDARIRRLQNTTSPIKPRPELPAVEKACPSATRTPFNLSRPPRPPPAVVTPLTSPSSERESPGISGNLQHHDESYDSNFTLDMMDATLAELTRDLEPDEMSV